MPVAGALPPSRFMKKTLMPDERVIRDARFSRVYTVSCYLALVSFVLLGAAVQYALLHHVPPEFRVRTHIPLAAGTGIGCWQFFWMMLKKWTTEIVLTDLRLIYKRGFFFVQVSEVDIEQLASHEVEQTFLGRMFDYGAIHIRCIEATDFRLPPIAKPYEFRNALELQKRAYREDYMKVDRLRRRGP